MISSLAWIRKGVAREVPDKYELTEEEFQRVSQLAGDRLRMPDLDGNEAAMAMAEDTEMDVETEAKQKPTKTKQPNGTSIAVTDPELAEYDLDNYDDPASDDDEDAIDNDGDENGVSIFGNIQGLSYHTTNDEDPYIVMNENENDSDDEDVRIRATDNMLVAARTEDDVSHLEVYVFEEQEDNLYVHHDVMLPSFPLCVEWLDFRAGRRAGEGGHGNYVAVGTFEPEIEIWDLDTVDSMYPDAILGGSDSTKKDKKKKKAKKSKEHHTDAIMALSWNKLHRNILASASADTTVKLWDLNTLKCAHSLEHHKDKVQAVTWHPVESTVLATGGYDRQVMAFDSRAPDNVTRWSVAADVEAVAWDLHSPQQLYVSTENGNVLCFDVRNGNDSAPVFTLQAHDDACSSVDVHPAIAGCLVTGSVDKTVKVWDVRGGKPTMVASREVGVGKVFNARFCPDSLLNLAVCGTTGGLRIWDVSTNRAVRRTFADRATFPKEEDIRDKPILCVADGGGMDPDSDDSDDDENDPDVDPMAGMDSNDDGEDETA
ncbi:WD40-repeat-containing domain protein [Syncephalis fuscata]|nr:WD40-repeat-containing domain protein [Syncephalis fuscata]